MIDDLKLALTSEHLTFTEMADGTAVLLDLDGHQVLSLNTTGSQIVRDLYAGATSYQELTNGLMAAFDIDETTAQLDTDDFLFQLRKLLIG